MPGLCVLASVSDYLSRKPSGSGGPGVGHYQISPNDRHGDGHGADHQDYGTDISYSTRRHSFS